MTRCVGEGGGVPALGSMMGRPARSDTLMRSLMRSRQRRAWPGRVQPMWVNEDFGGSRGGE